MKVTERDGYSRLEQYEKNDRNVVLPEKVNGKPLTVIGIKAFLSCRSIEQLVLPRTVDRIEDWAFAHMKNLKEIVLPAKDIFLGKKVFLGCRNLKCVKLSDMEGIYEGIPFFLATMVTLMEERPVRLELVGSPEGQWKWLEEYDMALLQYLERDDTYGFEPAFIGWFNVEDVDDQQQDFILERRKCKIKLAFQRLLYGAGLVQETEKELSAYLLKEWELVAELFTDKEEEYARNVSFYKIWQKIGGFEVLSPQVLLERLAEADPEVRAFLVDCILNSDESADFFTELEL